MYRFVLCNKNHRTEEKKKIAAARHTRTHNVLTLLIRLQALYCNIDWKSGFLSHVFLRHVLCLSFLHFVFSAHNYEISILQSIILSFSFANKIRYHLTHETNIEIHSRCCMFCELSGELHRIHRHRRYTICHSVW